MDFIETQTEYYDQIFDELTLQNERIESKYFEDCTFERCSFLETHFRDCRFLNCAFKECHLNLIHVNDCSFTNTKFEHSQVIGVNWTEASWPKRRLFNSIDFFHCVLNHSTFIGLKLRKIQITDCVARDVDFADADLTQAKCTDTDFSQSRFLHTNLTKADFSRATNYSIAAPLNTLKKTKFSLPEAMSLLYSLDIILDEI